MIPKLTSSAFSWNRWRRFNLFTCRYYTIILFQNIIRQYAIGYIEGELLQCRPKSDVYAVLFLKDNEFSWCHLTASEFKEIFEEEC
ncbi:MAG: hypothetical protein WC516_05120 [Patescibacteria group bacterium]